jgi:dihydrolipoamide dehydrogenase
MAKKVLIIGAGPGGYVAAIRAAQLGAEVTVVEKEKLGGTCLNWGCVPTKTLLHAACVYHNALHTRDFGVYTRVDSFRFDKMVARKNSIVQTNVRGIEHLFQKNGIRSIKGSGRLLDANRVEIHSSEGSTTQETADAIILATGSEPLIPGFIRCDRDRIITTTKALDLEMLPKSITIVGGSVSGCEFACLFALLGVKVYLVEMLDQLVPTEDADISRRLEQSLKLQGVSVMTGATLKTLERVYPSGAVKVSVSSVNKQRQQHESRDLQRSIEQEQFLTDYCLLTMGRRLNIDGLGLENIGIDYDRSGIETNEHMETSLKNVYAIGDVTGKYLLAHVASQQGIVAAENIMGQAVTMNYTAVPGFIYTYPEIASVGLREEDARSQGIDVLIGKANFKTNAMAYVLGKTDGFVKTVVECVTKKIRGIHILGPHATNLLGEAAAIVAQGMTVEQIAQTIHPHPTLCETVKEAILAAADQAIHA